LKGAFIGAPGWLSQLSDPLSVLAQVTVVEPTVGLAESRFGILSPPTPSPSSSPLSKIHKNLKKKKKKKELNPANTHVNLEANSP